MSVRTSGCPSRASYALDGLGVRCPGCPDGPTKPLTHTHARAQARRHAQARTGTGTHIRARAHLVARVGEHLLHHHVVHRRDRLLHRLRPSPLRPPGRRRRRRRGRTPGQTPARSAAFRRRPRCRPEPAPSLAGPVPSSQQRLPLPRSDPQNPKGAARTAVLVRPAYSLVRPAYSPVWLRPAYSPVPSCPSSEQGLAASNVYLRPQTPWSDPQAPRGPDGCAAEYSSRAAAAARGGRRERPHNRARG